MSDFGNRPFVPGTITGYRAFSVDPADGALMSPTRNWRWLPGENAAVCTTNPIDVMMFMMNTGRYPTPEPHPAGSIDCGCGFYAYFTGLNEYYNGPWRVQGLIEGYGRVTVGDRGFRAEKARLVALVNPPWRSPMSTPWVMDKTMSRYPDVPRYGSLYDALAEHPAAPPEADWPEMEPKQQRPFRYAGGGPVNPSAQNDNLAADITNAAQAGLRASIQIAADLKQQREQLAKWREQARLRHDGPEVLP